MSFHWRCPFCDRDTTITDSHLENNFFLTLDNADGHRLFQSSVIVCPNALCRKFTLRLLMFNVVWGRGIAQQQIGEQLKSWSLIPPSEAKVLPDYVPKVIRDDYLEACLIRDLSPKASATLSRRCLQGMIRDFWGVVKARLVEEIDAIKSKVDTDTWQAIDSVRKIGNIGAHMEKDINVIVDVEPDEAQMLIGLIELLVKDWYITRYERAARLKGIVELRDAKTAAKTPAKAPAETT
jgi:hypothetical protein